MPLQVDRDEPGRSSTDSHSSSFDPFWPFSSEAWGVGPQGPEDPDTMPKRSLPGAIDSTSSSTHSVDHGVPGRHDITFTIHFSAVSQPRAWIPDADKSYQMTLPIYLGRTITLELTPASFSGSTTYCQRSGLPYNNGQVTCYGMDPGIYDLNIYDAGECRLLS
jgi:hypothetical protein